MCQSPESVLPVFGRREQLLRLLSDAPRTKAELVRSLDISRSTVDRCVRALESAGLVERTDGRFQLTLAGELLFDEYQQFSERADGVFDAMSLLSVLPTDTDIEATALQDADVVLADRTAPYRPAESYLTILKDADRVDHVTTALSPQYVEGFRTAIVEEGVEARLGATQPMARRLVSEFAEPLAEILETGRVTMRELDTLPGYSFGIVESDEETTFNCLIYTDDGIRGRIETDDPEAVAYGRELFERHWQSGEPVEQPER